MKYKYLIIASFIFMTGCGAVGSSGTYIKIQGKATITEISSVSNGKCPDSVEAYFDFKPDNPDAVKLYKFPNYPDTHLALYENNNPAKVWLDKNNIKVGNVYTAIRYEAISGTATPFHTDITDKKFKYYGERYADGSYEDMCK